MLIRMHVVRWRTRGAASEGLGRNEQTNVSSKLSYNTVAVAAAHEVVTVRLDRAEARNALTSEMREELIDALHTAPRGARALVLAANGPAFSAGQDLGSSARLSGIDLENTQSEEHGPLIRAMLDCPVPTVCAVHGLAAGAGLSLALAADVTVVAESARLLVAGARIGLIPDAGATWWLPRRVGAARAMGLALLAEPLSGRQAADWGLVWDVAPDADLPARAAGIAAALARGPTAAYLAARRAMLASPGNDLEAQMTLEGRLQGDLGRTDDFREGVMAVLDGRPPDFRGG